MSGDGAAGLVERSLAGGTAPERTALATAIRWATDSETPLYLVGGAVRDALLGRDRLDLDLAVEGDLGGLLAGLRCATGAEAVQHITFETATVGDGNWTLDVARTRIERYAGPGDLPVVEPAPIAEDLGRRDFTIHALAFGLAGPQRGCLLDPFGGQADLARGMLKTLHAGSFRDDPTRILRLARYCVRLGFAADRETLTAARLAVPYLDVVAGARLRNELERLFREPAPERALQMLHELRALPRIYPELRPPATLGEVYARLRSDGGPAPALGEYVGALLLGWDRASAQRLGERLALERRVAQALRDVPAAERAVRSLVGHDDPVAIVDRLSPLSLAAVRAAGAALGGRASALTARYVRQLRLVTPELRGDDVVALGVPYGPQVGAMLQRLREARLRGELLGRDDETRLVRGFVSSAGLGE